MKAGSQYDNARKIFVDGNYSSICANSYVDGPSLKSSARSLAYQYANEIKSQKAREFCLTMKDSTIRKPNVDATKAG